MATDQDFTLNTTVSFDVHAEAVLGTGFSHMKVMGILDTESARRWIDPEAIHANIFPMLPDGTPDDPYAYHYVKIKGMDGQTTCVGLPWIIASSIEVHDYSTLKLEIERVSPADVDRIKRALSANGFRAVKIEVF